MTSGILTVFWRFFHWGPLTAITIIKSITFMTLYMNAMWWPPNRSLGGFVNQTIFLILSASTGFNFVMASLIGPKFLPLRWRPKNPKDEQFLQFCSSCEGFKAPRSHHCRKCDRCVIKMDHHCPWINHCVGWGNHAYFTSFLAFAVAGCLHATVILFGSLYAGLHRDWYVYYGQYSKATVHLGLWSLILGVFNIGLAIGVIIAVGMLLFFQVRAIVNNRTGIEDWIVEKAKHRREGTEETFRYPYDLGKWKNIMQVASLTCSPIGNGVEWAIAEGCDQFTLTMASSSIVTLAALIALLATLASCGRVARSDEPTYTSYRLPTAFKPEHYDLQVLTHLGDDRGYAFSGRVLIKMTCLEDANNVTLHSKNLTLGEKDIKLVQISDAGSEPVELKQIQYIKDNDYVVFHSAKSLQKGKRYEISIPFEGSLGTGLLGYYRSSYFDQQRKTKVWLSVTQFEPTYAREAFPCFDEPEMKATFDISLGHHKQYVALSNMPVNRSEPMASAHKDWVMDYFDRTVPMSTYLVAYSVNDFEYREAMIKMKGDVVFKIWARRDAIDQVDYAREVGPRVTRYYEEYFAEKFPLPKIDMIAIPDFSAGAMENWGLITYRETALLYHPNISTVSNKHRVASVIAHELAHQWFGNLVTMRWWTDLWLNEGFATYVASLGVEHLHPEWHSYEDESVSNSLNVFKLDALTTSHPVSVEIGHPNQISQIFDAISYDKGSTVIRMMHLFLGEDTFRDGVRLYLKRHKYANAEQNDLWAALTEKAHENGALPDDVNVKTVMESWTLQTGYPVVKVTRNYESNSAELTQVRFLSNREQAANASDYCWWVPLTYTTAESPNFVETNAKDWMMCGSNDLRKGPIKVINELPDKDQWVLFNIQLAGLYKVQYDKPNYKLIVRQLNSEQFNTISLINRAALIDDAMDLAWSQEQEYGIAFAMINYLRQETEYLPWKSALGNLGVLNRLLKRTPIYEVFRSYIQFIIEPIYDRLDIFNVEHYVSARLDSSKQRSMIASWACVFDVSDCTERSVGLFANWMAVKDPDTTNPIPQDIRGVVYCTAIRNGKEAEWNFLWARYQQSNVGSEKVLLIQSLTCSRETWLLQRFLHWSLNSTSGVRKQDTTILFANVAKNDIGFHLAKSFFLENTEQIYAYLTPDTSRLSRYLRPLAEHMASEKELQELKDLIESKRTVFEHATQGVKQALETVEVNMKWKSASYGQMARYLPMLNYRSAALDVLELI